MIEAMGYVSFYAACYFTGMLIVNRELRLSAPIGWIVGFVGYGLRSILV